MSDAAIASSRKIFVGIAGLSCSGKTHLALWLASKIRGAVIMPIDAYYLDAPRNLVVEERARLNFDSPRAIERALLFKHIRALKESRDISMPQYDFAEYRRSQQS